MGLDDSSAGDLLYQLGQHYQGTGQGDMAAEVFDALVSKYPNHALAPAALVWQLRYWSSGEVAWQLKRKNRVGGAHHSPWVLEPGDDVLAEELDRLHQFSVRESVDSHHDGVGTKVGEPLHLCRAVIRVAHDESG